MSMALTQRLKLYAQLMRLDKPIGILLLLWPTLWSLWFAANGKPAWQLIVIFTVGTVLMRSAGCVINDYADRDFDPHVARTKQRPLAAKTVSTKEALLLAGGLSLLSFMLILSLNPLTLALSVAALFLAASYPFTKRFFAIPQAYLGIAFGFGIPMSYAAQTGSVPAIAWLLLLGNIFWAVAYDTEYAMVDREDDIKIGIKTSALTFGRYDVMAVMLCYAAFLGIMIFVGMKYQRGLFYFAGILLAAVMALYHYQLIRHREPAQCFKAFLHNNWLGASIFCGLAIDYLIKND
jgi:4-hydroxybenzoate polyprenyltransferase